jgi:hypothetical protein
MYRFLERNGGCAGFVVNTFELETIIHGGKQKGRGGG